jgi:hypothetical protein
MARKIEKSIPWITMIALFAMVVFGGFIVLKEVMADTNYGIPSVTVGNSAPTVGVITLNSGNTITITDGSYVTVVATTLITDTNGYTDLKWATATLYNSATSNCGVGNSQEPAWCYYGSTTAPSNCATSSCVTTQCLLTCTFYVWYTAVPTDASSSPYAANHWIFAVKVTDQTNASGTGNATNELNVASYVTFTPSWTYLCGGGACAISQTSTQATSTATNTGNYQVRLELSGIDMASNTSAASITVTAQKWATETIMGDWVTGTQLQTTPVVWQQAIAKSISTTTPSSGANTYWQIKIPTGTVPATYYGTNTVTGAWTN